MSCTVLVIAKAPAPGRSKTRLVPPLSHAQAAELQTALLLDTVAGCRAEDVEVAVLYAGEIDVAPLRALLGDDTRLVAQRGRGLGAALASALEDGLAAGPLAIVSSDIPGVPPGAVRGAFAALAAGADVVLGPSPDGGYWLIAMRAFDPAPFDDVPWSTPAVLGVTRERCAAAGLRVVELESWRDMDTLVDLEFAATEIDARVAPRTAALVAALARAGIVGPPPRARHAQSALLGATRWRSVLADRLELDDGREVGYTYLAVPRAVFIVPVTSAGELVLVRQYRHPVRDWTLEVPAGAVEDGESPREAAERELAEEVGGRAGAWRHLTTFFSSASHLSLRSDVFLATGVELAEARPDADEHLATIRLPLAEALARARAGVLTEGQTALAVLLAAEHLGPS